MHRKWNGAVAKLNMVSIRIQKERVQNNCKQNKLRAVMFRINYDGLPQAGLPNSSGVLFSKDITAGLAHLAFILFQCCTAQNTLYSISIYMLFVVVSQKPLNQHRSWSTLSVLSQVSTFLQNAELQGLQMCNTSNFGHKPENCKDTNHCNSTKFLNFNAEAAKSQDMRSMFHLWYCLLADLLLCCLSMIFQQRHNIQNHRSMV